MRALDRSGIVLMVPPPGAIDPPMASEASSMQVRLYS